MNSHISQLPNTEKVSPEQAELSVKALRLKAAYSVDGACSELPFGRDKIYREIRAGRLEARKAGGRTIITGEAILAYLSQLPVMEAA